MSTLDINESLEKAQAILTTARLKVIGVNQPAWDKLFNAEKHLEKQQAELLADLGAVLDTPEAIQERDEERRIGR